MLSRRQLLGSLATPLLAGPRRPNILLILADDLGYGDTRCYNPQSRIETPNIDRLAASGARFTDAHSPSSVCTPTRYGLLTGRYCWRTSLKNGVLNGESPSLIEPGRRTIASMLKGRGYRTGGFGKWHLGLGSIAKTDYASELRPGPADFGFDEFFGIPASLDMPPYVFIEGRRVEAMPTRTIATNGAPPRGPFWRGGPIAPGFRMEDVMPRTVARAADFVATKHSEPYFAYVALTGPHTPWVPNRKGVSPAGLYGDFVTEVDRLVGDLVRAAGPDTLIFFTSDNGAPWSEPDIEASGGHRANKDWRGQKADIHEAGHRVPFIVAGPGFPRGVRGDLVGLTDIYTVIAAAVDHHPGADEAEDSIPIGQREAIIHHSQSGMFAIRRGDWKLVEGKGSGGFTKPQKIDPPPGRPAIELFNLRDDPRESRDVAAGHPRVVEDLLRRLGEARRASATRLMFRVPRSRPRKASSSTSAATLLAAC
jgi:arylsulfatase A